MKKLPGWGIHSFRIVILYFNLLCTKKCFNFSKESFYLEDFTFELRIVICQFLGLLELLGGARGAKLFRTFGLSNEKLTEEILQDINALKQPVEMIVVATAHLAISKTYCFHPGYGVSASQSEKGNYSQHWKRDVRNRLLKDSPTQSPLQLCPSQSSTIIHNNTVGTSRILSNLREAGKASLSKPLFPFP